MAASKAGPTGVQPMTKHFPKPPFKPQPQPISGRSDKMEPQPDYGETTYVSGATVAVTGW
jgi:hypothetical protein